MPSMLFTDLVELKSQLSIAPNNNSEDKVLNYWIEQVADLIEEFLGRKFLKRSRTEYYSGSGTQQLLLKARPVFTTPTIEAWVDFDGFWGASSGAFDTSTALTWGDDFSLKIDQDDGTSRSGILVRNNAFWPRKTIRASPYLSPFVTSGMGNIKVTYTAGYTVDTLPGDFRLAANLCIARLRSVMPLGVETNSESYEERSISVVTSERLKLLALVGPMLNRYRNWKW
jgi:hypothetical protein